MKNSTPIAALLAIIMVGGGLTGYVMWSENAESSAREARRQERAERSANRRQASREALLAELTPLREESTDLIPGALEGVALGLTLTELRNVRTVQRKPSQNEAMAFYEEMLASNSQVIYGFSGTGSAEQADQRLTQIQILSNIPPIGVGPHLEAMIAEYGDPTGIWNCPATGPAGVPMRRFTWRRNAVTIQDILLIHPAGVSQTLYIAPTAVIGQSLRASNCAAVRTREELDALPMASPEQIRQSLETHGSQVALP